MKPLFTNTERPLHEIFPKCSPCLKCLSGPEEEQGDTAGVCFHFYCQFLMTSIGFRNSMTCCFELHGFKQTLGNGCPNTQVLLFDVFGK